MASTAQTGTGRIHSFNEYHVVRLRYDPADAYEVEFPEPEWGVLTLGVSDISGDHEAAA